MIQNNHSHLSVTHHCTKLISCILVFLAVLCGCNDKTSIVATHLPQEDIEPISSQCTIILADVCDSNQGFSCTGLTYSELDNCFYVADFGQLLPGDVQRFPMIVEFSTDWVFQKQIPIYKYLPETTNVQGISFDKSTRSLWLADSENDKIFNVSLEGTILTSFEYTNPNGIAYDSRTDTLWVINNSSDTGNVIIKNVTKNGEYIVSISASEIFHTDQLYLDELNNNLYLSAGADYYGHNYIYSIDLSDYTYQINYVLTDSYAIEGICILENTLFVCNDGFYHSSYSNKNEIKTYYIDK